MDAFILVVELVRPVFATVFTRERDRERDREVSVGGRLHDREQHGVS